jgi:hypothetical protein
MTIPGKIPFPVIYSERVPLKRVVPDVVYISNCSGENVSLANIACHPSLAQPA